MSKSIENNIINRHVKHAGPIKQEHKVKDKEITEVLRGGEPVEKYESDGRKTNEPYLSLKDVLNSVAEVDEKNRVYTPEKPPEKIEQPVKEVSLEPTPEKLQTTYAVLDEPQGPSFLDEIKDTFKSMYAKVKGVVTPEGRFIHKAAEEATQISALQENLKKLSDTELKAKTEEFKARLTKGETIDDIKLEAFAVTKEACQRVLGFSHFDVQTEGALALQDGKVIEMKTGEGKTITSTMPIYLNALSGKGVHVITSNEYLAARDAKEMGEVYKFLGLKTGVVLHQMDTNNEAGRQARRDAYNCDITYGTLTEFGFDYLRDNMAKDKKEQVQRGHNFCLIDEVDNTLIDEARTPLIISQGGEYSQKDAYLFFAELADCMQKGKRTENKAEGATETGDYIVKPDEFSVYPTEQGIKKAEKALSSVLKGDGNLYSHENEAYVHYFLNALQAKELYRPNEQYMVVRSKDMGDDDGNPDNNSEFQVVLVDEGTGQVMKGRKYSDGIQQAIEAKERFRQQQDISVSNEQQTMATITIQNYLKNYVKEGGRVVGMSGTVASEKKEFKEIYGLDVVDVPTNKPCVRKDLPDIVYKTEKAKFDAVLNKIVDLHAKGQPILVGTRSVDKSYYLSELLEKAGIPHQVLNAKEIISADVPPEKAKEMGKELTRIAEIISQAGKKGAVTIATNMAGRGVDIKLDKDVKDMGLAVIGTERHRSVRIDNQLRGRSGRQGDPGFSQFYLSLEDNLLKDYGGDKAKKILDRFDVPDDQPIEGALVHKFIEETQKKVEGEDFSMRKNVVSFDALLDSERAGVYDERQAILDGADTKNTCLEMADKLVDEYLNADWFKINDKTIENLQGLKIKTDELEQWKGKAIYRDDFKKILEDTGYYGDDIEFIQKYSKCDNAFEDKEALKLRFGVISPKVAEKIDSLKSIDDKEELSKKLKDLAHEAYEEREKELGADNMRKMEKDTLLYYLDEMWINHVNNATAFKDGVWMASYAQKDPRLIYTKGVDDMFQEFRKHVGQATLQTLLNPEIAREAQN